MSDMTVDSPYTRAPKMIEQVPYTYNAGGKVFTDTYEVRLDRINPENATYTFFIGDRYRNIRKFINVASYEISWHGRSIAKFAGGSPDQLSAFIRHATIELEKESIRFALEGL